MTTFIAQNYETLAGNKEVPDANKEEKTETPVADETEATGLSQIKVTLTGPISEIIAKALNAVFKNPNSIEILEEEMSNDKGRHVVSVSNESSNLTNSISVFCIDLEHINKDPVKNLDVVKAFALENKNNAFIFIDTNKSAVNKTKESWFIDNAVSRTNGFFFSQESLVRFIKNNS